MMLILHPSKGDLLFVRIKEPVNGICLVVYDHAEILKSNSVRYIGKYVSGIDFLDGFEAVVKPESVIDVLKATSEVTCG